MPMIVSAAGFTLTNRLLERGYEVVELDNLSSGNRANLAEALQNTRFKFVEGDLSHLKTAKETCYEKRAS